MPHRVPRGWAPWRTRSGRTVVTDSEVRQGPRGRPVLVVLIASGVLLGLYLVGMMVWTVLDRIADAGPPERAASTAPSSALNTNDPPAANPAYPVPAVPAVK